MRTKLSTSSLKTPATTSVATTTKISSSKSMQLAFLLALTYLSIGVTEARKHHLEVRDDTRPYIALSTFGFYTDGHLDVKLSKLHISDEHPTDLFGLSLDKTTIDQMNPYLDSHQNKCILEESSNSQRTGPILFFLLDLKNLQVKVQCSPEWKNFNVYKDNTLFPMYRNKRQSFAKVSDSTSLFMQRRRRETRDSDGDDNAPQFEEEDEFEIPATKPSQPQMPQAPNDNKQTTKTVDINPKLSPVDQENGTGAIKPPSNNVVSPDATIPKQSENEQKVNVKLPSSAVAKQENKSPNGSDAGVAAQKPQQPELKPPVVNSTPATHELPQHLTAAPDVHDKNPFPESSEEEEKVALHHALQSSPNQLCRDFILPLTKTVVNNQVYYNMSFSMFVATLHDEGLYNLYFHACPNYRDQKPVSFNVDIEENNNGNFLSAGEMPLPALYFMMSLLFFLSGLFWVFILKKSKNTVYKIHYIMAVLVFLKSLSLMFHSINYHFIEVRGEHVETWAILYYITHLLKGAVLFITIVLIGTGWTFIKHILSDKDKKIFMIVIPLQVLANVAEIIIDESEESDIEFRTWRNIFIFVDLLCCGAILFPIVWSIRHLHEASATDGKAAINLRKLKLFRQFYIMIVCYIYFTRIIVYLLKMTVAFQYAWLDEMFHEMATYVFFVLTGYKFRPVPSHPYFAVGDEDPDEDEVEVLTESGLTQGLHRTKALNRNAQSSTTVIIEGNDEERETFITKRESSHEYD